ncbi:MAG: hypothetical protein JWN44_6084 [Myxococcales bacterium]|nr:hypothetical protein [Myxococcales bacterium]
MLRPDPFAAIAAEEEFAAAACAAVAPWVPSIEADLHALAATHLQASTRLAARPRRWLKLLTSLRASLAAVIGTELGALMWLRKQEQRLIDRYVDVEGSLSLTAEERSRLRQGMVPAAFERFQRVDQWIMLREEQGVYA